MREMIIDCLKRSQRSLKAREIASILSSPGFSVDRRTINQQLYSSVMREKVQRDANFCWSLKGQQYLGQDLFAEHRSLDEGPNVETTNSIDLARNANDQSCFECHELLDKRDKRHNLDGDIYCLDCYEALTIDGAILICADCGAAYRFMRGTPEINESGNDPYSEFRRLDNYVVSDKVPVNCFECNGELLANV